MSRRTPSAVGAADDSAAARAAAARCACIVPITQRCMAGLRWFPHIACRLSGQLPLSLLKLRHYSTAGGKAIAEDSLCVICQEFEATCGFLHGSSLHKCACK